MIVDLLKSHLQDTTTISAFSVGFFSLDCQLEESHESNLVITENPMESGAVSSDHSYLAPKRYGVRGIMVSYEPFNPAQQLFGGAMDFAKSLPLPMGMAAQIDQAAATFNRYAGQAINVLNKVQNVASKLAPWLPDSLGFLGDESPTAHRFEKIYADLLSIQASGEFLTVTSGLRTYDNLLLESVAVNLGTDDSIEVSLAFKEVHVVETRTVSGLVVNIPTQSQSKKDAAKSKPDGVKKTARAADQAAKAKAKGKTSPVKQTPEKQQSLLSRAFG